jgi:hypothetical protein
MPNKKTWYQQQQKEKTREKAHHEPHPPAANEAVPAAGTPGWLAELLAFLEQILAIIPSLEGHTTEQALTKEVHAKLERLKKGLPK